jgi:hypothetical protein
MRRQISATARQYPQGIPVALCKRIELFVSVCAEMSDRSADRNAVSWAPSDMVDEGAENRLRRPRWRPKGSTSDRSDFRRQIVDSECEEIAKQCNISKSEAAVRLAAFLATSPNISDSDREALEIPKGIPDVDTARMRSRRQTSTTGKVVLPNHHQLPDELKRFFSFADKLRHHL